jgi:hypothetical protein
MSLQWKPKTKSKNANLKNSSIENLGKRSVEKRKFQILCHPLFSSMVLSFMISSSYMRTLWIIKNKRWNWDKESIGDGIGKKSTNSIIIWEQ